MRKSSLETRNKISEGMKRHHAGYGKVIVSKPRREKIITREVQDERTKRYEAERRYYVLKARVTEFLFGKSWFNYFVYDEDIPRLLEEKLESNQGKGITA